MAGVQRFAILDPHKLYRQLMVNPVIEAGAFIMFITCYITSVTKTKTMGRSVYMYADYNTINI